MYDNTAVRILEQIYLKPGIHKRELSKQLKLGMPSIDYGLKKISNIVKQEKKGNQINYSLDYSKEDLTQILSAVEHSRLKRLPPKTRLAISDFLTTLDTKPIIAAIFGSHATGNYTKDSDIDIFLVFQKIGSPEKIEKTAQKTSMKTNTQISPAYIEYAEFKKSFHDSTKEFFRKLKKDKILLTGIEWWRQLAYEET